jgi:hypothetical protein
MPTLFILEDMSGVKKERKYLDLEDGDILKSRDYALPYDASPPSGSLRPSRKNHLPTSQTSHSVK